MRFRYPHGSIPYQKLLYNPGLKEAGLMEFFSKDIPSQGGMKILEEVLKKNQEENRIISPERIYHL